MSGKVYLVGAGPGDAELLTVKAARLLREAEVVLHDALVSDEILAMVGPGAEIIDVGKRCGKKLLTQEEINALLVRYAELHSIVVRLKGGDPSLFGRGGEELEALRDAGIEHEVVPGITAALGAAAAARISLTDRRKASHVVLATFSRGSDASSMDWGAVTLATTLVLYMPGKHYAEVSHRLSEAGMPADLPCVIVSRVGSRQQSVRWTSVADLAAQEELAAPALMIIGRVAARDVPEIAESFWSGGDSTAEQMFVL